MLTNIAENYTNAPRKKAKFLNFVTNSCRIRAPAGAALRGGGACACVRVSSCGCFVLVCVPVCVCVCLTGVDGNLTLHGVTKPVHLTIDHFHCGFNPIALKSECGVNAYTVIKRSEFDVDKYVPAIGDDVKIVLQVEATKD